MNIAAKTRTIYKQSGLSGIIARGAKKIVRLLFDTNSAFWFMRDLSLPVPAPRADPTLTFTLEGLDELIPWIQRHDQGWMFSGEEIGVARQENHFYAYLKKDSTIIGYIKVAVNRVYVGDFKQVVVVPTRTAFIYDMYIVPEHRKQGGAAKLTRYLLRALQDRGFTQVACHIPAWNRASTVHASALGFKKYKYVRFIRIAGIIKIWFQRALTGCGKLTFWFSL